MKKLLVLTIVITDAEIKFLPQNEDEVKRLFAESYKILNYETSKLANTINFIVNFNKE